MLELRDITVRAPKLAYTFLLLKLTCGRFHVMFDFVGLAANTGTFHEHSGEGRKHLEL